MRLLLRLQRRLATQEGRELVLVHGAGLVRVHAVEQGTQLPVGDDIAADAALVAQRRLELLEVQLADAGVVVQREQLVVVQPAHARGGRQQLLLHHLHHLRRQPLARVPDGHRRLGERGLPRPQWDARLAGLGVRRPQQATASAAGVVAAVVVRVRIVLVDPGDELVDIDLTAAVLVHGVEHGLHLLVRHVLLRDLRVTPQGTAELVELQRAAVVPVVVLEQLLEVLPARSVRRRTQLALQEAHDLRLEVDVAPH